MIATVRGRQRATSYLLALLFILLLNFLLPRMMPGDPLLAIYGEEALVAMTPQLKAELVERFALDKNLWQQLGAYFLGLVQGDLGYSYLHNAPVSPVILIYLPWTLLLIGTSLIISTITGVILGIQSGWVRGSKTDHALLTGMMSLSGFPDFFLGMLLLIAFGATWGLFPLSGAVTPYSGLSGPALVLDVLWHAFLPVCALALAHLSNSYLLTRNSMVMALKEPYILTARAKGLPERVIKYRHAGRNSMLPVITQTGIGVGRLVTGALFVEMVFAYPGIGYLTYEALSARDYPLLQGIFLIVALSVLVANFLADLSYSRLDPRIGYAH